MAGERLALIVANDDYGDPELRRLAAPARDAAALAQALGDPAIGRFDVQVLRNQRAHDVRVAVEQFFTDRAPEDLLLLHFSCHGLKNSAGQLFLAVADTQPALLAATGIAADFVNQQMFDSRAQRVALFLDCCYGGAFPRGMAVRAAGEAQVRDTFATLADVGGGRGRVVVTASSAMEYAFEGSHLTGGASRPSLFTGAVVDGLTTGEADRDGDGWIGVNELVAYVSDQVRRHTSRQTPQMWTFGAHGDLRIARSRVRRIIPTPLPEELAEAIDSPLAAVRFGMVDELRERLADPDLRQAYGAWQALVRLTRDDSVKVSRAARQAVAEAVPRTSVDRLDLTTTAPGAPVRGSFTVTGPPIARAAVAESSTPWLTVSQDAAHVRVVAAPVEFGESAGEVKVAGPTGERLVRVRARVAPPTDWRPPSDRMPPPNWTTPPDRKPPSDRRNPPLGAPHPATAMRHVPAPAWVWRVVATSVAVVSCGCAGWMVPLFYAIRRRSWPLGLVAVGYFALSAVWVATVPPEDEPSNSPRQVATMIGFLAIILITAVHAALLDPTVRPPRDPDQRSAR